MASDTPTRQRLLDAAVRTIEAHGEGAIRVREIASEAGVAYTSVYHFFGDREGLVHEAQLERYRQGLFAGVDALRLGLPACASAVEFRTLVAGLLHEYLAPDRANLRRTRLQALQSTHDRPSLARRFAEVNAEFDMALGALVQGAQARGWIRPGVDPRMLAAWYRSVMGSRVLIELDGPAPEHVFWNKYTVEAILAVAMGIAPDPDG